MNDESPYTLARSLPFKNVSGETIPAFAVMAVTGISHEEGVAFLTCDKPNTTFRRDYAVNNAFDVAAAGRGSCFRTGDVRALYAGDMPAAGEGWGPRSGQWSLVKGFPGFKIDGVVNADHGIARIGFSPIMQSLIKTTADIGRNTASTSYRIYTGTLGSESDAGFTSVPSAHNHSGQSLANGEWAWLAWTNNGWELRSQQNRVHHVTATGTIAGGGAGSITLPDGRTVSATNWSSAAISTGDKVLVWQDFSDGVFYVGKFGGTSVAQVYHVTIPSPGVASLASINITLPTAEVVSAKNWSSDSMATEDYATVYKDGNDGHWYLIKSGGGEQRWIAFRLVTQLTTRDSTSNSAMVDIWWGGSDPGSTVTVYNLETDYPDIYKFSGDANAIGYAVFDARSSRWRIMAIEGDGRRWQLFLNIDGDTMPAHAVLQHSDAYSDYGTGSHYRSVLVLQKVDATFSPPYWINGDADVAAGHFGLCCTTECPFEALYHGDEISLAAGDSFGPKPSSYELWQHRPGFTNLCFTELASGNIYVKPEPIQQLLVKTTDAIADDDDSDDYIILTGELGGEVDGGWTTVPAARNRTGAEIPDDTICYVVRLNGGWNFKLFTGGASETRYFALLNGAMESGDSSGTIDTVKTFAGDDGPAITTAANTLSQAGANNAKVIICKLSGDDYFIENVARVEVPDVTDVDWDGTDLKQTKRTIVVQSGADDSSTSTIDTPTECT